ncbi:MAG: molybdenum cofactor guanylyltransferase [Saccharospirillaceae bacterium]|nr:molybdenum cofactor guanylyltransferase [Saccharospirillaceae bacterium]MCD8532186.1 molybdenum cofactor guanylyltransferase [Saccharospirillaceae bacterium]
MNTPRLAAVLLAGGSSRRMGQDKALLPVNGFRHLGERNWQQLIALKPAALWLSRQPHQTDLGLFSASECGDKILADNISEAGPLAGIQAAVEQALLDNINEIIVLPVDMPHIRSQDLQQLISSGRAACKAACYQQNSLPICLPLYLPVSQELLRWLNEQLQNPAARRSVGSLIHTFDSVQLPSPGKRALTNTNTPDEWAEYIHY